MAQTDKPTLREQIKDKPGLTPTDTDVTYAGARNPNVTPDSGRLVTPDPGNVVDGQGTKSN